MLRRSVEPGQYLSIRCTERLADEQAVVSVGSRGDSYDSALAESVIGLFKTELVKKQGSWRSFEQLELATARWVDWYNTTASTAPLAMCRRRSSKRLTMPTARASTPRNSKPPSLQETLLLGGAVIGGTIVWLAAAMFMLAASYVVLKSCPTALDGMGGLCRRRA